MAGDVRFFGSVRFNAEANLDTEDLLDYVLRIEGRISGGLGADGSVVAEEENVGLIEAYLVQIAPLADDGVALGDVCDAHSAHLEGVYAALFDEEDEPREELAITRDWETLLHVHWLEVESRYRDSGVAVQAVEAAVRHFCPAGVVTAYRNVLELSAGEWRSLGFRKIAGSDVVYRDNTAGDPYAHPFEDE
ncbi:MAG TPA: hypothetical protein VF170_13325 [Planctomycetaceae bacterium]